MKTKMNPTAILLLALPLMGLSSGAAADQAAAPPSPALTLEEAITEARTHSPTVRKAQAAADENSWRKTEVLGQGFMPKLTATANHYFNSKYEVLDVNVGAGAVAIPLIYPETTVGFGVQVPLFDGLANVEHLKAASLLERAAQEDLEHAEFQLDQDTKLAFYQALAAQQLEDVAEENVRTLEDHLKETDALKKGGAATNYDVLRVQVQLTEARSDAADAHDNAAIARRKLTLVLGLEQDSRKLEGALPVPEASKVDGAQFEQVPAARTDLAALAARSDALDKEHTAASLWLVPKISAGAEYDLYNDLTSSISSTDQFRSAYSVGIFLQWNLFDGGVSIARANEAAAQREQADRTSEEAKLAVPYDFDLWKRKYVTSTSRYEAKRLDVERSKESVRLAKLEQRAGSRTSTEVLDAELDLYRARAGVVNSQMSAAEALIKLETTLGRRI